jgi:hypothetical protein
LLHGPLPARSNYGDNRPAAAREEVVCDPSLELGGKEREGKGKRVDRLQLSRGPPPPPGRWRRRQPPEEQTEEGWAAAQESSPGHLGRRRGELPTLSNVC